MSVRIKESELPAAMRLLVENLAPVAMPRPTVSKPAPDYRPMVTAYCLAHAQPLPEAEYRFHTSRQWRFDFAWINRKLAMEVEGITGGKGGRHQRRDGYRDDCEKYAEALCLDWRVLRVTPAQLKSGEAWNWLDKLLGAR